MYSMDLIVIRKSMIEKFQISQLAKIWKDYKLNFFK